MSNEYSSEQKQKTASLLSASYEEKYASAESEVDKTPVTGSRLFFTRSVRAASPIDVPKSDLFIEPAKNYMQAALKDSEEHIDESKSLYQDIQLIKQHMNRLKNDFQEQKEIHQTAAELVESRLAEVDKAKRAALDAADVSAHYLEKIESVQKEISEKSSAYHTLQLNAQLLQNQVQEALSRVLNEEVVSSEHRERAENLKSTLAEMESNIQIVFSESRQLNDKVSRVYQDALQQQQLIQLFLEKAKTLDQKLQGQFSELHQGEQGLSQFFSDARSLMWSLQTSKQDSLQLQDQVRKELDQVVDSEKNISDLKNQAQSLLTQFKDNLQSQDHQWWRIEELFLAEDARDKKSNALFDEMRGLYKSTESLYDQQQKMLDGLLSSTYELKQEFHFTKVTLNEQLSVVSNEVKEQKDESIYLTSQVRSALQACQLLTEVMNDKLELTSDNHQKLKDEVLSLAEKINNQNWMSRQLAEKIEENYNNYSLMQKKLDRSVIHDEKEDQLISSMRREVEELSIENKVQLSSAREEISLLYEQLNQVVSQFDKANLSVNKKLEDVFFQVEEQKNESERLSGQVQSALDTCQLLTEVIDDKLELTEANHQQLKDEVVSLVGKINEQRYATQQLAEKIEGNYHNSYLIQEKLDSSVSRDEAQDQMILSMRREVEEVSVEHRVQLSSVREEISGLYEQLDRLMAQFGQSSVMNKEQCEVIKSSFEDLLASVQQYKSEAERIQEKVQVMLDSVHSTQEKAQELAEKSGGQQVHVDQLVRANSALSKMIHKACAEHQELQEKITYGFGEQCVTRDEIVSVKQEIDMALQEAKNIANISDDQRDRFEQLIQSYEETQEKTTSALNESHALNKESKQLYGEYTQKIDQLNKLANYLKQQYTQYQSLIDDQNGESEKLKQWAENFKKEQDFARDQWIEKAQNGFVEFNALSEMNKKTQRVVLEGLRSIKELELKVKDNVGKHEQYQSQLDTTQISLAEKQTIIEALFSDTRHLGEVAKSVLSECQQLVQEGREQKSAIEEAFSVHQEQFAVHKKSLQDLYEASEASWNLTREEQDKIKQSLKYFESIGEELKSVKYDAISAKNTCISIKNECDEFRKETQNNQQNLLVQQAKTTSLFLSAEENLRQNQVMQEELVAQKIENQKLLSEAKDFLRKIGDQQAEMVHYSSEWSAHQASLENVTALYESIKIAYEEMQLVNEKTKIDYQLSAAEQKEQLAEFSRLSEYWESQRKTSENLLGRYQSQHQLVAHLLEQQKIEKVQLDEQHITVSQALSEAKNVAEISLKTQRAVVENLGQVKNLQVQVNQQNSIIENHCQAIEVVENSFLAKQKTLEDLVAENKQLQLVAKNILAECRQITDDSTQKSCETLESTRQLWVKLQNTEQTFLQKTHCTEESVVQAEKIKKACEKIYVDAQQQAQQLNSWMSAATQQQQSTLQLFERSQAAQKTAEEILKNWEQAKESLNKMATEVNEAVGVTSHHHAEAQANKELMQAGLGQVHQLREDLERASQQSIVELKAMMRDVQLGIQHNQVASQEFKQALVDAQQMQQSLHALNAAYVDRLESFDKKQEVLQNNLSGVETLHQDHSRLVEQSERKFSELRELVGHIRQELDQSQMNNKHLEDLLVQKEHALKQSASAQNEANIWAQRFNEREQLVVQRLEVSERIQRELAIQIREIKEEKTASIHHGASSMATSAYEEMQLMHKNYQSLFAQLTHEVSELKIQLKTVSSAQLPPASAPASQTKLPVEEVDPIKQLEQHMKLLTEQSSSISSAPQLNLPEEQKRPFKSLLFSLALAIVLLPFSNSLHESSVPVELKKEKISELKEVARAETLSSLALR